VCNRDVFERNIEFASTLEEVGTDAVRDSLTLCNELGGIKLCYDSFEDFVSNRRENTLIIV